MRGQDFSVLHDVALDEILSDFVQIHHALDTVFNFTLENLQLILRFDESMWLTHRTCFRL